jgi:hypothetical protein
VQQTGAANRQHHGSPFTGTEHCALSTAHCAAPWPQQQHQLCCVLVLATLCHPGAAPLGAAAVFIKYRGFLLLLTACCLLPAAAAAELLLSCCYCYCCCCCLIGLYKPQLVHSPRYEVHSSSGGYTTLRINPAASCSARCWCWCAGAGADTFANAQTHQHQHTTRTEHKDKHGATSGYARTQGGKGQMQRACLGAWCLVDVGWCWCWCSARACSCSCSCVACACVLRPVLGSFCVV